MAKHRPGEVLSTASGFYILTSRRWLTTPQGLAVVDTWTPIPDGMTAADLGRKFKGAWTTVEYEMLPPAEEFNG